MKLLKNKFIEFSVLLLIIIASSVSMYYLYNSYLNYNKAQNVVIELKSIDKLNRVLYAIGDEEDITSVYIVKDGDGDFTKVKEQWEKTDNAIYEFNELVAKSTFLNSENISETLKGIQKQRAKVSVLNTDLKNIYFTNNSYKLSKPIALMMEKSLFKKEQKTIYGFYINSIKLIENSYDERTFISYLLFKNSAIQGSELEIWDTLIGKNILPNYSKLDLLEIKTKLDSLFGNGKYSKLEDSLNLSRISIFTDMDYADFTVNPKEWHSIYTSKIELLKESQSIILNTLLHGASNNLVEQEKKILISAISLFIFLIILFVMKYMFSNLNSESKGLEHILKNIEYDEDSNNAIQELIKGNDREKIYKFIEMTINDAKESKKEADKANTAKSLFLANMSHEIRTPLNGIMGFTDLLKESNLDKEQSEFIEIIKKSSNSLLTVINNILDLSKIESEKVDIESVDFEPMVEFESAVEQYAAKVSEKNISFNIFIDPNLGKYQLKGDPSRVRQVLVNLISNAVKFTPEDGTIEVSIVKQKIFKEHTDSVLFSVNDSGIGITKEQKEKIFEPFTQADSTTSRKYGGTGLGLTISNLLVQLMGGELKLESEPNKGSKFFFELEFEQSSELPMDMYNNISAVYYTDLSEELSNLDSQIDRYIKSSSTDYRTISNIIDSKDADILFVRFSILTQEEKNELKNIKSKIVILAELNEQAEIKKYKYDFLNIIYMPYTYSKINRSFTDINTNNSTIINRSIKQFIDLNILVAEDNLINQSVIEKTLKSVGANVTMVNNGKEALSKRIEKDYDIILMDIQMPVMNGIEATKSILHYEEDNNIEHIPIVAITANALSGDREKFLAEGLDDYMSKPINIEFLRNMLVSYFPHKLKTIDIESRLKLKPENMVHVDILLCKYSTSDASIFEVLFKKIGYSVIVASDYNELNSMLLQYDVKYALFDKRIVKYDTEKMLSKLLHRLNIKSILFVDNLKNATSVDRGLYTMVTPNVPNIELLRSIIVEVNKLDS